MMCHETSTVVVIGIKHRNKETQVVEIFKKYLAYQFIKLIYLFEYLNVDHEYVSFLVFSKQRIPGFASFAVELASGG